LFLTKTSLAQFKVTKLEKNTIPEKIKYVGKLAKAIRWRDKTGDNIVVLTTTTTQSKNAPDEGHSDRALYAYHYLILDDSIRQTWRIYDYVKECMVDMFLYFVDNTFDVTDLNTDGIAEVWIMYKVSCQGDVSPVPMKIIMYENDKKFAVRGTTQTGEKLSETKYYGGEYTFDKAFKNGPVQFRQYAQKLWTQHKVETWKQ